MKPLVEETLKVATSQIGVRENGRSNSGAKVDAYLRAAGVGSGNPWCAGFVDWCIQEAAKNLKVANPFIKSGYTPDIGNWAKEHSILIGGSDHPPQSGDVFLVRGAVRFHHVGFVQSVQKNGWTSLEGNSNSDGSREGYEVANNKGKPFASRFYWVRWSVLCDDEIQAAPSTRALFLGGRHVYDMPVAANISLVPVEKWCHWMSQVSSALRAAKSRSRLTAQF